jgi:endonuclease III
MAKMARKKAKKPARAKTPSVKISKTKPKLGAVKGPADAWGRRGTDPARVSDILKKLDEAYPAVTCALEHETPFQLLISTILSAQCTDVRVNQVTKTLYKKYPKPEAFAYATPSELEQEIRPTGFFRNKTKSIMGASKKIVEEFGGVVPHTMAELLTLPGVARKTANVVLGTAFGIADGVVVDTHVTRLSERLDLSHNTDAKRIELDLMAVIPKGKWIIFAHQLIWHGRRVCQARKPRCTDCNLERLCYSQDKTFSTIPMVRSKTRSKTGSKQRLS